MDTGDIEPDTKDWTWVLERPCTECGLAAGDLQPGDFAAQIRDNAQQWAQRLDGLSPESLAARIRPGTWSVLEYTCHVRDVHRIFDTRVHLMLEQADPTFPNWDQDEAAVASAYAQQDPATVLSQLREAAEQVARAYESVPSQDWGRRGLRSNGDAFTITTLGQYHLHDVVHHLHDIDVLLRG